VGRWFADALPDARYALIEGAAHAPFLSHADQFLTALTLFLNS
jgi:pimeloyl-[acyl-carrier protein] methyl ester esterase